MQTDKVVEPPAYQQSVESTSYIPIPAVQTPVPPPQPHENEKSHFACCGGASLRFNGQVLPREITSYSVFGGLNLDLRGAILQPGQSIIRSYSFMGGVSIIADANVQIETDGNCSICGGFGDERPLSNAPRNNASILVKGFSICGGVGVSDH
jgi:hypothetical protein